MEQIPENRSSVEFFNQLVSTIRLKQYPYVPQHTFFEFRDWYRSLTDKQLGAVATEVFDFAKLSHSGWYKSKNAYLDANPNTHTNVMMVNLLLAVFQRNNLALVKKIMDYIEHPLWRGNAQFGWQLYMLMVEANVCEISGDFLLATERERKDIIQRELAKAIETSPQLLIALAREANALCTNKIIAQQMAQRTANHLLTTAR